MKKLLTVLTLIVFCSSAYAADGWTKFTNSVDRSINTVNQKEQQLNNKIDKAQAERAARKAEAEKKAAQRKAEIQARKEAQKKAAEETKKAVDNEVSFWRSLIFWK